MSRRTCVLLALVGVAVALPAGVYAPQLLGGEEPDNSADIVALLDPCGEHKGPIAKSNLEALIEVQIRAVLTSPIPRQPQSHGIVRDCYRLLEVVSGDQSAHVMQAPKWTVLNGHSFFIPASIVRTDVAEDGVTPVTVELGLKAAGTPTLCEDGKIHLQVEYWLACKSWKVHSKGSFLLQDGQTCYIGGLTVKAERYRGRDVPLLCELPGVGEYFRGGELESCDAEVMFLATPKLVAGR